MSLDLIAIYTTQDLNWTGISKGREMEEFWLGLEPRLSSGGLGRSFLLVLGNLSCPMKCNPSFR